MSTRLERHVIDENHKIMIVLSAYARLLDLSHEKLVRVLGVSGRTLNLYEKGFAYIPDDFLKYYADYIALYLSYNNETFWKVLCDHSSTIDLHNHNINVHCHSIIVDIGNQMMESYR